MNTKEFLNNEYERMNKIFEEYSLCYKQQFDEMSSKVVRVQYGVGGECLHRGYYCPSIVEDVVVGNSNRGKILKRVIKTSKPSFAYGFDSNDNLIIINYFDGHEFIIRKGQVEIGIAFDEDGIKLISECQYDGERLKSYITCFSRFKTKELYAESYDYSNKKLSVDRKRLVKYDERPSGRQFIDHTIYNFSVNDGYLSSYTTEHYEDDKRKSSVWDGHVFDVDLERKVNI